MVFCSICVCSIGCHGHKKCLIVGLVKLTLKTTFLAILENYRVQLDQELLRELGEGELCSHIAIHKLKWAYS